MKKIFVFAIISVLLMASNAFAAFSISSATINPSETVTTRESLVTISVILEAGDATSATVSIDSNAISPYLSCSKCSVTQNPSTSPTFELQVGPQQAKSDGLTFTITATPNTGNTATTNKIIYINNPPTLSLSTSSSRSSVVSGSSVTITLTVSNTGGSSATGVSAVITAASGFTLTGGSTTATLGTIAKGGSTTTSWTYTASSPSSSNTFSIRVTDNEGDDTTTSLSITGPTTTTTTPGGGTDGGSVSVGNVTQTKSRHNWTEMKTGVVHKIKITDKDIGFKQIIIEVNNKANNVTITITKLAGKPASVIHNITGKVYQYIEITHDNLSDSNIKSAKVNFNVSKSWLSNNSLTASDVSLRRYSDNVWEKLGTTKIGESTTEVEYEASTLGLSVFAIVAEASATTTTTIPAITTTTTIPATTTTTIPVTQVAEYNTLILIAVIIVIALALMYLFRRKKSLAEKSPKLK